MASGCFEPQVGHLGMEFVSCAKVTRILNDRVNSPVILLVFLRMYVRCIMNYVA